MKYDDLIKKAKRIYAPSEKTASIDDKSNTKNMKNIIDQVKAFDIKHKFTTRIIQIIFALWIVFVVSVMIKENDIRIISSMAIFAVALALGIYMKQLQLKSFIKINYSCSISEFLKEARERTKFFCKWTLYGLFWFLFDLGICILVSALYHKIPFGPFELFQIIIMIQIVLVIGIAVELMIAYNEWKKKHKPIIDEIDNILQEMDAE